MTRILFAALALAVLGASSSLGSGTDQAVTARIQGLLTEGVGISDEDKDFLKDHAAEAIGVLEPSLNSPDPKLRVRSFVLLTRVPGQARKYIAWALSSDDPVLREKALVYGTQLCPNLREVVEGFVQQLADSTEPSERIDKLVIGKVLDPNLLAESDSERLRTILEGVATTEGEYGASQAVFLLGKLRGAKSLSFLQTMTNEVAVRLGPSVSFANLPVHLNVALAMHGDPASIQRVADSLGDETNSTAYRDSLVRLLSLGSSHLRDKKEILRAIIDLVRDPTDIELRIEGIRASGSASKEESDVSLIYNAANALALCLDIPPTTRAGFTVPMDARDVVRIKSLAAARLGLTPENPPDR